MSRIKYFEIFLFFMGFCLDKVCSFCYNPGMMVITRQDQLQVLEPPVSNFRKVELDTHVPRHSQVSQQIREALMLGCHKKGEKLPSERKLVEYFGVSRVTVRRALDDLVREGTIEKVWSKGIFVKKDFVNANIKGNLGLFVFNDEGIQYHPAITGIVKGINDIIKGTEYGLNIVTVTPGMLEENNCHKLVEAHRLAGVIVYSREIPDDYILLLQKAVPRVMLWGGRNAIYAPCVRMNLKQMMFKLTEHLISLGHNRIVFLMGPVFGEVNHVTNTAEGFRKALDVYGLDASESYIEHGGYTIESGHEIMTRLVSKKPRPTAVIAHDSIIALGALKAVKDMGVKCPEEISLASFNNFELCEHTHPPLTAMKHPYDELGRELARGMVDFIEHKRPEDRIISGDRIIVRGSTGTARGVSA